MTEISGARESNAGDDFHVLWAARIAAKMLNPHNDLRRVVMEGLTPADLISPPDDPEAFLGIDLTEYYAGEDANTSTKIVVSQLKYSTRNPNASWTASRLCSAKKGKKSVLRRLADAYKNIIKDDKGQARPNINISIRLVTNQSIDNDLKNSIEEAKKKIALSATNHLLTASSLFKQVEKIENVNVELLKTLYVFSNLLSSEFVGFLNSLDISKFGEAQRIRQHLAAVQQLSESVSFNPQAALSNLCTLIRNEAMPEARNSRGIGLNDVLAALGVGHIDDLFPSPSKISVPDTIIPTSDVARVAQAIIKASSKKVIVHGAAGVGKSTTIHMLSKSLPQGSILLTYDCYGRGDYLSLHSERHTVDRAITQLSNDMALSCDMPFSLSRDVKSPDALRNFERRLNVASQLVNEPGALLVIVIDAADNSAIAGRGNGECFVPYLWPIFGSNIPANCRLVMTARSHRIDDLGVPSDTVTVSLNGFDMSASAQHFRTVFPVASDRSCDYFHTRTSGNPRVQNYLLSTSGELSQFAHFFHAMRNAGKTPKKIFDDILASVTSEFASIILTNLQLAMLICMKRPIPIKTLALAWGIDENTAHSACLGLSPGIVFENNSVSFRDEDFETYIRDRFNSQIQLAHSKLADLFLEQGRGDTYAAEAVAEHLIEANRYADLINLAINEPPPPVIIDDVRRLQVYRRRLQLALIAAAKSSDVLSGAKLAILDAEAAKADEALASLIKSNPEMAAQYGDSKGIARIYSQSDSEPWMGGVYFRLAGYYSRNKETHSAAHDNLLSASAWMRHYRHAPEYLKHEWKLTKEDVSSGAEAVLNLAGTEKMVEWVKSWKPLSEIATASILMVANGYQHEVSNVIPDLLEPLSLAERIQVLSRLWGIQVPIPLNQLQQIADQLIEYFSSLRTENNVKTGISDGFLLSFCELCAWHQIDREVIQTFLGKMSIAMPHYAPSRLDESLELAIRYRALRFEYGAPEPTKDNLLPDQFKKQSREEGRGEYDPRHADREHFNAVVGAILPAYMVRAAVIAKSASSDELVNRLEHIIPGNPHGLDYDPHSLNYWQCQCLKLNTRTLLLLNSIHLLTAKKLVNHAKQFDAETSLDVLETLATSPHYSDLVLKAVQCVAKSIITKPMPSSERWQALLRAAEIANPLSADIGRELYLSSLDAAKGLDDNVVYPLRAASRIACEISESLKSDHRTDIGLLLAGMVEADHPFVTDDSSYPWNDSLHSLCHIDPHAGLALLRDWEDRNIRDLSDGLEACIDALFETQYLSEEEAFCLSQVTAPPEKLAKSSIKLLNALWDKQPSFRQRALGILDDLCDVICRDASVDNKVEAMDSVLNWVNSKGLSNRPSVLKVEKYRDFISSSHSSKSIEEQTVSRYVETDETASYDDDYSNIGALVKNIFDDWSRYDQLEQRLSDLSASIPLSFQTDFLNAVVESGMSRSHSVATSALIGRLCEEWRLSSEVRNWTYVCLPKLIEGRTFALLGYYDMEANLSNCIERLPTGAVTVASLMTGLSRSDAEISVEGHYAIALVMSRTLQHDKRKTLLEWLLDLMRTNLQKQNVTIHQLRLYDPPSTASETLATFFWSLFGHPDKRLRWMAIRAARKLLTFPGQDTTVLGDLVYLSQKQTVGDFCKGEHYWMSARLWGMILFQRLCYDIPNVMQRYAHVLLAHATSTDLPHAQLREFARRAVLRLIQDFPRGLSESEIETVTLSNQPKSCIYPRRRTSYIRHHSIQRSQDAFPFETMDTEQYWFDFLTPVFDDPAPDALQIGEDFACNKWGRSREECRARWPEEQRYDWGLRSARHGGQPTVETLSLYLDYHSLQCAAGVLVDSNSVCVEDYDDAECPWEHWISRFMLTYNDYWLADLRECSPLRPEFYGGIPNRPEWALEISDDEIFSQLGLNELGHTGDVVVFGGYDYADRDQHGSCRIESALVTPKTAKALAIAMQTADRYAYDIPVDIAPYSNAKIEADGYRFLDWLRTVHACDESVEDTDPLLHNAHRSFVTVGYRFIEMLGGLSANTHERDFLDETTKQMVTHVEFWGDDTSGQQRRYDPYSYGDRLWVSRTALLSYLKKVELDLFIRITISHREEDYSSKGNKSVGRHSVYIIRQNGTIEGLDSNLPFG